MPLSAFIIRPFGKKDVPCAVREGPAVSATGLDGQIDAAKKARIRSAELVEIDFEDVHKRLIAPALSALRIDANTTGVILSAGNIREDMFHLLMTADLVVADVTIHNPNVFYELGIRHAFRDKFTFLMRSNVSDYPFDLKTDRYFEYDHHHPDRSVRELTDAIKATLNSERSDSPVFRLLPRMRSEDRSRFISVPREFKEELERAKKYRRPGDLRLLAAECEGFLWEVEGLREIGRAQFDLNYIGGACTTWEQIVRRYPDDVEANMVLTTLYQRLNDHARSEQSLARVMRQSVADVNTAAEIRSLAGRNLRSRWFESWRDAKKEGGPAVETRALRSPYLRRAIEEYAESFRGNLNYINAGLNALSLLTAQISLASRKDSDWCLVSEPGELDRLRTESDRLTTVLEYSFECEGRRLQQERRTDFWFLSQRANFLALTSESPGRVEQAYLEAMAWAPRRGADAMRRNLSFHQELGVCHHRHNVDIQANIQKALSVIRKEDKKTPQTRHVVLFAGLRMEPLSRGVPSSVSANPANASDGPPKASPIRYLPHFAESRARQEISKHVNELLAKARKDPHVPLSSVFLGMASGSNGADLLFHQVSQELGIETRMFLALPKDQYVGQYVSEAGPKWIDSFNEAHAAITGRKNGAAADGSAEYDGECINVLVDCDELPRWLQSRPNYTIARRNELWMLQHALVERYLNGPDTEVTLIVLWSPSRSVEGGLASLIEHAERSGVRVLTIDCTDWVEKAGPSTRTEVAQTKAAVAGPAGSHAST